MKGGDNLRSLVKGELTGLGYYLEMKSKREE